MTVLRFSDPGAAGELACFAVGLAEKILHRCA